MKGYLNGAIGAGRKLLQPKTGIQETKGISNIKY